MSEKGFRIRKVRSVDLQSIKRISDSRLREDYSLDLLSYFIENHSQCFHVAEVNNEVVGFIIGVPLDNKTLRILMLAVTEEYSRNGIGSGLFEKCLDHAKLRMMTALNLEVSTLNESAYEFYRNRGFKVTGILPKYYKDKTDAYIMKRFIVM